MAKWLAHFLREYVLKNLPLKLVSLGIAVLLWWAVGRDQPIEIPVTVRLEFQHAPASLDINSDSPLEAHLTLRGPQRVVQNISPAQVHAVLDLRGASPGERTFDLTAQDIHMPPSVKVVQIVPSQFQLDFDRSVARSVPVEPRVIGTLISGYGITGVSVDPTKITIVGPQRRVDAVQAALTDPVDATGVVGSGTFTTHAYVADPLVRIQRPQPIHVTVSTGKVAGGSGQP
jgi:YbbR domain-containing protein